MKRSIALSLICLIAGSLTLATAAQAEESYTRQEDVIYGRKFGTALTMDVFTPKQDANGAAVDPVHQRRLVLEPR